MCPGVYGTAGGLPEGITQVLPAGVCVLRLCTSFKLPLAALSSYLLQLLVLWNTLRFLTKEI